MDVLDKLRREVRRLDWQVKQSLSSRDPANHNWHNYAEETADHRDLLEQAVREIEQQRLRNDLCRSVIADYQEQLVS